MTLKKLAVTALIMLIAAPVLAQSGGQTKMVWKQQKPVGPVGLDGAPPSPMCRSSLGSEMAIHCLHNIVWHGGRYFIDDVKDPKAKPVN